MFLLASSSGLVSLCWVCKKVPLGMKKTMKSCQTDQQLSPFWKLGAIHLLYSVGTVVRNSRKTSHYIAKSQKSTLKSSIFEGKLKRFGKIEETLILFMRHFLVIFQHCVLKNRGCHSQNHKGDEGLPKGVVLTFPWLNMLIEILMKKEKLTHIFSNHETSKSSKKRLIRYNRSWRVFSRRCKSVPCQVSNFYFVQREL